MSEAVSAPVLRDRARVEATVSSWKDSLLDLSQQNPLIALPQTGVLDMLSPNEVFDPLVRRRKALHYWDLSNKNLDRNVLRETGNYAARATALENLRQLHNQAVALLTGQDINVLFIAFGLLKWIDPTNGEMVQSPLLLVPIHLEPHAEGTGYTITCMEEPVEVNPILRLRLAREDIGFALPQSPDERYLIPSSYLGNVATSLEEREGWSVEDRTVLGRFPLLKLRLYEDLIAQEERALSHPLIAALAGQKEALEELPAVSVPNLSDLERVDADESHYLLLDADPAQERAIVAAARGQSFVLQGPPGTGKTQTITNIIGECAAAGKSVLLVSGRMASLDAVHHRLADKGLGDLCLLAHSLKASKRGILAQLEQTLSTPVKSSVSAGARAARQKEHDEIKSLRTRLNDFTAALHEVREPLGISVYEAAGMIAEADATLASLSVYPELFAVRDVTSVTPAAVAAMEAHVTALADNPALSGAEEDTLWAGAFRDAERSDIPEATERTLQTLEGQLRRMQHAGSALAPIYGMSAPEDLAETDLLLAVSDALRGGVPRVAPNWLTGAENPAELKTRAVDLSTRYARFREERDQLLRHWDGEIFTLPHAALIERLSDKHAALLEPLLGSEWRDRAATEYAHLSSVLEAVGQDGRVLNERIQFLGEKSGLSLGDDLEARQRLLKIARQAIDLPNPCVGWFAPGAAERLMSVMNDARDQWERYRKGTEQLFPYYSEDILDLNHGELLQGLEQQRGGIGRLMSAFNNKVMGTLKSVTRPGANTKDREAELDIQLAAEMKEVRRWCLQSAERLTNSFGSYYLGMNTDWEALRTLLEKSGALCDEFDDGRVPAPLIALMLLGDSDLKQFESVFHQVSGLLAHLREAWEKMSAVAASPEALPDPTVPLDELTAWCDDRRKALTDLYEAYRTAMHEWRADDKDSAAPPVPVADVLRDLQEAVRLVATRAAFDAEFEAMSGAYGPDYKGKDTDWNLVFTGLETASRLRTLLPSPSALPDGLLTLLAEGIEAKHAEDSTTYRQVLADERAMLTPALEHLEELFKAEYLEIDGVPFRQARFARMTEWATVRLAGVSRLGNSLRLQSVREGCMALRLDGFFDALAPRIATLPAEALVPIFRSGFYRAWTEAHLAPIPGLLPFSGAAHEAKIDRFRELDRRQLDTVPGLVRELVRVRSPKNYPDEVKTLKGQLARRRTGEVRRLLSEIPNLVFALKPIVMMNPLSVRLFLDADALRFDVVLFDDASQISTEDAVGAILRGQQVIIAGDPKQIPPLALLVESDKPFESILDAANAVADKDSAHFGKHTLRWHYRSRNESLIAFSRRYFYPELVSFPSATVDSAIDYVESVPNAEGVDESGPAKVVDAILAYAKAEPQHTIGVVALDDADYERIADELARRKEADPDLVLPYEDEEIEGFFLKTLENVQGDERDMVVLYVGTNPARCKPLSAYGGERLLNVAITRARCRMVVVSAFAHDAPLSAEVPELKGMLLLRSFLRYAKEGVGQGDAPADDPAAGLLLPGTHIPEVPAQSRFEHAVETLLREKGHQIRRQVGLSEYRVDLAVVDPVKTERYLLGIEFDGPMYATGETARHRDRLRVEMLTDRGWNLHRVWALDWETDPKRELARIESAIASAKKSGIPAIRTRPRRSAKKEIEEEAPAEA